MIRKAVVAVAIFFVSLSVPAQDTIVYRDASDFTFYGRIHNEADNIY